MPTGSGWVCSNAAQVVTCTTSAVIPAGANAPPIAITVNVAAPAGTSVTNVVTVAGGGESNTSNNSFVLVSPVEAPDLSVTKTSTPAIFTKGQAGVYTIQVTNVGNAASLGLITVTDTLDPSLAFVSATGPNFSCSAAAQVVTCTSSTAIPAGASSGLITINVNVSVQAGTSVTNTVTVAGGEDSNPANNASQLTSDVNAPDLTVSKTAAPTAFSKGQNGVYTITARNSGDGPSSGTITVTDTLGPNLTFVSATGSNWSCSAAAQVVTCTTSAVILAGANAPPITMTVNVAANAPTTVTNNITIAGGGETNTSNNSSQLVTPVDAVDLNVFKTANPATFTPGQPGVYSIQVSNIGNAASSGTITVTDTLDPNLTFASFTGSNWSCSAAAQVVTCTTSAAIPAGASSSVMITVNVAANGQTTVTNMVAISGGGDVDPADNTFTLVSNVNTPDLTVSKTANPATFTKGQNGVIYTITALNSGTAPSSGMITVTDTLGPNLTFVSATGSNWSCSAAAQVVTCTTSAAILAGASAPPITMTVNVAANARDIRHKWGHSCR